MSDNDKQPMQCGNSRPHNADDDSAWMFRNAQEARYAVHVLLDSARKVVTERDELRADRDALREHVKNLTGDGPRPKTEREKQLEGIIDQLHDQLNLWRAVDQADREGKAMEILRNDNGEVKGIAVYDGGEEHPICPDFAKEAAKSVLGESLYEAFMRGARAEIAAEQQERDNERLPR